MVKMAIPWEDHFHVDPAQMSRIIAEALSRGGDYADLFFEYRIASSLAYEDHLVKNTSRGIVCGVGIRVIHGDQVGFAFSDDLSLERMLHAARTAAHIAHGQGKVGPINVTPTHFPNLYPITELTVGADVRAKLGLVERCNRAARAHDPRVTKVNIHLTDEVRHLQFVSSEGTFWRDVQPMIRFDVTVVAQQGDNRQSGYHGGGGRYGMEYFDLRTPEELGAEASRLAVLLLDAVEAPAGPLEVVLGCADSGILLHEAVGHGLEADFNRKGLSNYSDRIGEPVASSQCTIVDAGLFENMRGTINIDDEGNLPRENVLIENGVLRGYMHDRLSAQLTGVQATGNGRREAYNCVPLPRMTNTYMLPGQYDPEEIIRSVKRGIYAKRFGGGQVDITKGDFVFSVNESYLIEDGKLTVPLKNVTLIGNGPEVMTRVTMVGNDLTHSDGVWTCGKSGQRVPVGVGTPTIKISEITVGGTGR